ncbi:MAG: M20 metallopeptidase family protein [Bacteroidia bacterium]
MLKEQILNLSQAYFEEIRQHRRYLHAHPELSFHEFETSKYIAEFLKKEGIEFETGWVKTGIVATINGKNPHSKTIMLRADIDALPIFELNSVDYKSKNEGVMHACGHDVHTTAMLGAILILNDTKDQWEGSVKIIFQPGEEKLPGGASLMINEGLFQKHPVTNVIGQHVLPELETGKVGFKAGNYMASCDEIYITVNGKGGHGALAYKTIDPILISSHIVVALQQVVSRNAKSIIPSVLSIGYIQGLGATNVIPDKVEMKGTFRTYDEAWRMQAHENINRICKGVAESMGATVNVNIIKGYPNVYNYPELTNNAQNWAKDLLGAENVVDLEMRPTGEDFAFLSNEVPGTFYRLGTGNQQQGITAGLHNPKFNIDENALKIGMGLMAWLAIKTLSN